MAKMSKEVQALLAEVPTVAFGTVDADGVPNICAVGMKRVIDDETIMVSDQFFNKTLANLKANPNVTVCMWAQGRNEAYQIKGTARYDAESDAAKEQMAWVDGIFAAGGAPITSKGICFIDVTAVYQVAPGPGAGDRID